MLAPDDRAVLREELRPDPGWRLDAAVATTFTLDLTAALVAPLAFAAQDLVESSDPISLLEAVRSAADRVDVFCQAGQIRVPPSPSDLMAFLEPMVHDVQPPIPGGLFHPKVWVLRYRGPDGTRFRLLCGSRNLTEDVSWDALLRLDGAPAGRRPRAANRPLVQLVSTLPTLAVHPLDPARMARIAALAGELATVEWESPVNGAALAFHVLGLRRQRTTSLIEATAGTRHLVVSPFVDDVGLAALTADSREVTLVSRAEDMEMLSPDTVDALAACRVVSPMAGLSQPDESAETAVDASPSTRGGVLGGLHAKFVVVEWARQASLFLGSANATDAGVNGRNVEVMVEIRSGRKHLGVDQFVGEAAPMTALLEPYEATGGAEPSIADEIAHELENLLRRIASHRFVAAVEPDGHTWREVVTAEPLVDLPDDVRVTVALLTRPGTATDLTSTDDVAAVFSGLPLPDITPFLVVRASRDVDGTRLSCAAVLRASLAGDPPQRLDEVIARQVDTPEKFLRFLALLLGFGRGLTPLVTADGDGGGGSWALSRLTRSGVFEMLVRAATERPDAFADLERLIPRLQATERGRAVLPEGFDELWTTCQQAHALLADTTR